MFSSPEKGSMVTAATIAGRLRLLELDGREVSTLGRQLQTLVIRPNLDVIVDRFCDYLQSIEQFNRIVAAHSDLGRLRQTQRDYLQSFGVNFQAATYFEGRQRIGATHQALGVPQSLYQCAFRHLQDLIIGCFPQSIRDDQAAYVDLLRFVLKIVALDNSLAVESYCTARVSNLTRSLASERGKTEKLRQLSVTDQLTDLYNHSYARHCLNAALSRAQRESAPLCVIMADLDHFKEINDTHGHLVGDDVLRITAARMVAASRTADQIGRYGGEEFIFILQDTNLEGALEAAERIRMRVCGDPVCSGDIEVSVSISLGISCARRQDTVTALIERADEALYAAKAVGRNCVRTEPVEGCSAERLCGVQVSRPG
jgi:diguanylate cyclase (GGDEF)-like protein